MILLRRPEHEWPLVVAGNRDEMRDRGCLPPARHWPDRPEVVAGLDSLGGGSWLGVNDHGVVAAVMNREGSLGPAAGKRSRGELVLEALDHAEAGAAVDALADLSTEAYRAFNLFVGDPVGSYWVRHTGEDNQHVDVREVAPGLHMLTAGDMDDARVPRSRVYLPQFRAADIPRPEIGDWHAWRTLLASRLYPEDAGPRAAMNLDLPSGFATLCSQLVAIPRYPGFGQRPLFLFANGPPDRAAFEPVPM